METRFLDSTFQMKPSIKEMADKAEYDKHQGSKDEFDITAKKTKAKPESKPTVEEEVQEEGGQNAGTDL